MADLWSDDADSVITAVDAEIDSKYKMSIRDLLTAPGKYASQQTIQTTIKNMRSDMNSYVDGTIAEMTDEKRKFEDAASKADAITKQLAQNISMQAKQNTIPFIKPVAVIRDTAQDQTVYIDSVDAGVLKLVEKFSSSAMFIADYTTTFQTYSFGNWFFSGPRNYILAVNIPESRILSLSLGRDELNTAFDAAMDYVRAK